MKAPAAKSGAVVRSGPTGATGTPSDVGLPSPAPTVSPGAKTLAVLAPPYDLYATTASSVALQGSCDSVQGSLSLSYGEGTSGPTSAVCLSDSFSVPVTLTGDGGLFAVTIRQASSTVGIQNAASRVIKLTKGTQVAGKDLAGVGSKSITVGVDGNAYLVGLTAITPTGFVSDANGPGGSFLMKLDPAGNLISGRQFRGVAAPASAWQANVVKASPDGSIYVLGSAPTGGTSCFLAKFDSDLIRSWVKFYGGTATDPSDCDSLAVSAAGEPYVAGTVYIGGRNTSGAEPITDFAIYKFDAAGNQLWVKSFASNGFDAVSGISVDRVGAVYFAGATDGALLGATRGPWDQLLGKLDASGNLAWMTRFGSATERDYGMGAAVTPDGQNIYTVGIARGTLPGSTSTGTVYVAKFNATGAPVWNRQFGGDSDLVNAIAVDSAGNAHVAGWTYLALDGARIGSRDFFLRMFTASGSLLWGKQLGVVGQGSSDPALAVRPEGAVYLAGTLLNSSLFALFK